MATRARLSPQFVRLLQLAVTLLMIIYMLLIGGTFDATVRFRVQMLNFVAGSGVALAWLIPRLWQRQRLKPIGLEWPLLVFAGTQIVALLTAVQPRLALEPVATLLVWCAALFILCDLLANSWPREFILNALVVACILLAADGVISAGTWTLGWLALGQAPPVTLRFFGLLTDPNITACVLNLLLPFILMRAVNSRAWRRLPWALLATGMLVTEFFTSSRAGWIACAVMLIFMAVVLIYRRESSLQLPALRQRWHQTNLGLKLTALAGLLAALSGGGWLLAKQSQNITHISLLQSRQPFWLAAWQLFQMRPVTGVGPDLYAWFYSRFASIPPDFFAPHAHSLPLQILNGSGLLGLAGLAVLVAAAAMRLWRIAITRNNFFEHAAWMAGLVGFAVQHLFHYLLGTPFVPFLLVVVLALACAPLPGEDGGRASRPIWLAPVILVPIGIFAFAFRAAQLNDTGLLLAQANNWPAAATAFEQAGAADPSLTLYWEEAAFARTRAGQIGLALPLWQRAARDDPYWAVSAATVGALAGDAKQAAVARQLAPGSYLFALNAGVIAESQGDLAAAQEAYASALSLKPASAGALFWQQTALRSNSLAAWRATLPVHATPLDQGWAALDNQAPGQAILFFQQAITQDPNVVSAYQGLGQAQFDSGDLKAAQQAVETGLRIPVNVLEDTLGLHLLAGDVADAHGDRAGAMREYGIVFSAIADYNIDGPGTYGYNNRSWQVFRRATLPVELVPELPRADITGEMDQRFTKLAQWYQADGEATTACLILTRVQREAPMSVSGRLAAADCH
jgi:tetratricopeptide (TPR) repeat protein